MAIFTREGLNMTLPKMIKVKQNFHANAISDIENTVYKTLSQSEIRNKINLIKR